MRAATRYLLKLFTINAQYVRRHQPRAVVTIYVGEQQTVIGWGP